jgi:hypothetical protein
MTKTYFDVCNGDADGLCSVIQWRLQKPSTAKLVTGLKRDIELLKRVTATVGDEVLVCDLSMRRNRSALIRLLNNGANVIYFDHHEAGEIPLDLLLEAHIDLAEDVCTSLLVDQYLGGRFRAWAIVGAYGDNLAETADALAMTIGLSEAECEQLRTLGESINYNAYGETESDAYIAPADLYQALVRYADPLDFLAQESLAYELDARRLEDLRRAEEIAPYWQDSGTMVYLLPDAPWSRRIIGSMGNMLAANHPGQAHAVLRQRAAGDLLVSVRAPLNAPHGAAYLARLFGGDGRAASAGIDHLSTQNLPLFIQALSETPWTKTSDPSAGINRLH